MELLALATLLNYMTLMEVKNKRILIFIILPLMVVLSIYSQIKGREQGKLFFSVFNQAKVNSKIQKVEVAHKGVRLILVDGQEFVFFPYTDKVLNNGNIFDRIAEKGDSVIKLPYSDTIYLFKDKEVLKYTFHQYD